MKLKKIDRFNYLKGTKVNNWPRIAALSVVLFQFGIGGLIYYYSAESISGYLTKFTRIFNPEVADLKDRIALSTAYANYKLEKQQLHPEESELRKIRVENLIKEGKI